MNYSTEKILERLESGEKLKYLTILLSIVCFSLSGQGPLDCDALRKMVPSFTESELNGSQNLNPNHLNSIAICLGLDSLDLLIFSPAYLGSEMFILLRNEKEINYGNIMDEIQKMKSSEEYVKGRLVLENINEIEKWKNTSKDSIKSIDDLKIMIQKNPKIEEFIFSFFSDAGADSNLIYEEAYNIIFDPTGTTAAIPAKPSHFNHDLEFGYFREIISLNQLKETYKSKPILLYFTAQADVNSRKMENFLFEDSDIQNEFNRYHCFFGFVDNHKPINEEQNAQFPDLDLKTKGQFLLQLERIFDQRAYQPLFVIVDSNFELVDSMGYTSEREEFLDFLKQNSKE